MNTDRAREKLGEIESLAELAKGRTHDDHEQRRPVMRQIQREADRALEALAAEPDPEPVPPDVLVARNLKHRAVRGGYPHPSFGLAGWPKERRLRFYEARKAAGDTAVVFDCRTLVWPTVFHGVPGHPHPPHDLYDDPDLMHEIAEELDSFGLEGLPVLMSNTERGTWEEHRPRIAGGLREWGEHFRIVCIGTEANIFFGQWLEGPNDHPGRYIDDALMSYDPPGQGQGLKDEFPYLKWAWHGQGFLPVPAADIYWHQWPWESHRMSEDQFIAHYRAAEAMARSIRVRGSGQIQEIWAAEFAQHRTATEADADRMRGWLQDAGIEGFGS